MPPTLDTPLVTHRNQPLVRVSGKSRHWFRRLAGLLIFGCVLFLVCYVFRASLLNGLAEVWVVNDPTAKADAIVVLGGGLENRPFAAARLYHDGIAPMVLYTDVQPGPAEEMGIVPTEAKQTQRILLSNGVPEIAMVLVGTNVASTYDESLAVRDWIKKTGAKTIIIPTDPFHTRRVCWIFNKELRDTKTDVHVVPVNTVRYRINDWWTREEGLVAFQNEFIKYLYYRCKY